MSKAMLSKPPTVEMPVPTEKRSAKLTMEARLSRLGARMDGILDKLEARTKTMRQELAVRTRTLRQKLADKLADFAKRCRAAWAELGPALGRAGHEIQAGAERAADRFQHPEAA